MSETLLYILKANLVLSTCFLFYWFLLRHEKFFILNRFILLGSIFFSFLLPLLPGTMLPGLKEKLASPIYQPLSKLDWLPTGAASQTIENLSETPVLSQISAGENRASSFSFFEMGVMLYLIIACGFFIRFIWQLYQISRLLKGNETKKIGGIIYHRTAKPLPSFSFFHHLVINTTRSDKELEQVIAHEKVHIKQWHMADILLANLVQIICWINPLVWMLNRTIRLNLEYIADAEVLNTGIDRRAYQVNILTSCLNPAEFELANLFNSSKIKLRIKMMNANKSPQSHLYKYVLLLPILLASYVVIHPANAQMPGGQKESVSRSSSKPSRTSQQEAAQSAQADRLIEAINENNETLFNSLLRETNNVNSAGSEGWTPLLHSVAEKKQPFVQLLLNTKADINYNPEGEPTPLMRAVLNNDFEMVRLLVEKGANVNKAAPGDGSPLIAAVKEGNEKIVLFLVEKGADINLGVPGDGNPLIAAAASGQVKILSYLVDRDAAVNAIVPGDETALINAAGQGHLKVVQYLFSKGADVNLAVMANEGLDPELRTPLNQAVKFGHKEVAAYLQEKGAKK